MSPWLLTLVLSFAICEPTSNTPRYCRPFAQAHVVIYFHSTNLMVGELVTSEFYVLGFPLMGASTPACSSLSLSMTGLCVCTVIYVFEVFRIFLSFSPFVICRIGFPRVFRLVPLGAHTLIHRFCSDYCVRIFDPFSLCNFIHRRSCFPYLMSRKISIHGRVGARGELDFRLVNALSDSDEELPLIRLAPPHSYPRQTGRTIWRG